MYDIRFFDIGDMKEIKNLADEVGIDEPLDTKCQFIIARHEGKLAGFVGFRLDTTPRFEHIVLARRFQKTRLGVLLMKAMEEFLRKSNFKQYASYILNSRLHMQGYAVKWGMKAYAVKDNGIWFYKNL